MNLGPAPPVRGGRSMPHGLTLRLGEGAAS